MLIKHVSILTILSFIFHFLWETLHLPLYTDYGELGGPLPITIYATLGDAAYTLGAFFFISLFKKTKKWILEIEVSDYVGLLILGFCIALFVEYKALALDKWKYTIDMPLLFGIGISPLIQMSFLLPLCFYCTNIILKKLYGK